MCACDADAFRFFSFFFFLLLTFFESEIKKIITYIRSTNLRLFRSAIKTLHYRRSIHTRHDSENIPILLHARVPSNYTGSIKIFHVPTVEKT